MSPSEPPESGAGHRRKSTESDDTSVAQPSRAGGRRRPGGRRKKEPKRFGKTLTLLIGALVVALLTLGAVLYVQGTEEDGADQAAPQTRPALYQIRPSGSEMTEVLGSHEKDSRPLNEGELFERNNEEISSQDIDFTLRDSDLTEDCSEAMWGDTAQQALADAECTQAGRATYVADDYFGVAAVFNLADTEASQHVAETLILPETDEEEEEEEAPEDPGFLLAPSGEAPFDRLGTGYSAADAVVSGHYLVIVWVQREDSESVEERATLSSPLVALANFRNPLYRRLVELGGGEENTEDTTAEEPAEEPIEEPVEPVDPVPGE